MGMVSRMASGGWTVLCFVENSVRSRSRGKDVRMRNTDIKYQAFDIVQVGGGGGGGVNDL